MDNTSHVYYPSRNKFRRAKSKGSDRNIQHHTRNGSRVEALSLTLPIFHGSFLLTSGFFPENKEISAPPPCWVLIGIYLFYKDWSTETFRKNGNLSRGRFLYSELITIRCKLFYWSRHFILCQGRPLYSYFPAFPGSRKVQGQFQSSRYSFRLIIFKPLYSRS